jgi:uncharacterized membrane protein
MVERKRDRLYGAIVFIIVGIIMFGVGYYMGTEEAMEETVYLLIIGPIFIVFGIFLAYAYYAPEKFERFKQKVASEKEKEKDPEKARRNRIILVAVIIIIIFIIIAITLGTLYGDWD